MKERVGQMVGRSSQGMPWLGTFHSIGVKILRRHAEMIGLKPILLSRCRRSGPDYEAILAAENSTKTLAARCRDLGSTAGRTRGSPATGTFGRSGEALAVAGS